MKLHPVNNNGLQRTRAINFDSIYAKLMSGLLIKLKGPKGDSPPIFATVSAELSVLVINSN
jgi:hypothetical protein